MIILKHHSFDLCTRRNICHTIICHACRCLSDRHCCPGPRRRVKVPLEVASNKVQRLCFCTYADLSFFSQISLLCTPEPGKHASYFGVEESWQCTISCGGILYYFSAPLLWGHSSVCFQYRDNLWISQSVKMYLQSQLCGEVSGAIPGLVGWPKNQIKLQQQCVAPWFS